MSRHLRRRTAFSIIELMVVIAVIGLLLALLLPAVQKARESARRVQCQDHLRQISLALQNYVSQYGPFPPGAVAVNPPHHVAICATSQAYGAVDLWDEAQQGAGKQGTSWMVQVLPFVEQSVRFNSWDFTVSVIGNRKWAEADIPLFYCPSRRGGVRSDDRPIMFGGWAAGGTDYGGCIGGCNGWHDCGAHETWVVADDRRPGGPCRGVFTVNSRTRTAEITDGLSNTILLGELQRLNLGTDATTSRDGWAAGGVSTMFSTCGSRCDGPNTPHFEEMGSEHTGGAFAALADGSVRFTSDTINVTILRYLGSIAGDGPTGF